jgi:elongation factor G
MPLQIPIGREGQFRGVVDLLSQQALVWETGDEDPQLQPIPLDLEETARSARQKLIDAICETDEVLLGQCLEGDEPSMDVLLAALRRATISGKLVPVLCGASRHRIGVQPLLDAIVAYLPSPVDLPPILGFLPGDEEEIIERADDPSAPLCAAAFKIVTDPHVGHLTWVRVFSGSLKAGEMVHNARTGENERVSRIYRIHGNQREQVGHLAASDVVALVGVKSAITGDTLCDPNHPIMLETFKFPESSHYAGDIQVPRSGDHHSPHTGQHGRAREAACSSATTVLRGSHAHQSKHS